MIVLALRVTHAGTWETWEDELTFDRLAAIRKSMAICPPEFMTIMAIAVWAGAVKPPEEMQGQAEKNALSAEQFTTLFGGGGELGASGTFA